MKSVPLCECSRPKLSRKAVGCPVCIEIEHTRARMASPRYALTRALSAIGGWVPSVDLWDALEETSETTRGQCLSAMLCRLVREGVVLRRKAYRGNEYRLAGER
jgi:hypothetical protein